MKQNATFSTSKRTIGRPKDEAKGKDIARAASALFLKDGYELTSMEAVARKADVSKLTIYSHFADKSELFREVIRQRCDKFGAPETFVALQQVAPEQALTQLGITFVTHVYSSESVQLHRIMQAEAVRHPEVVQIFYETGPKRIRQAFGDLLKFWVDQKQLAIPDIAKATEQFFSLLKGELHMKIMLMRASRPGPDAIQKHVRATVDFFLAAYATPNLRSKIRTDRNVS